MKPNGELKKRSEESNEAKKELNRATVATHYQRIPSRVSPRVQAGSIRTPFSFPVDYPGPEYLN